MVKTGRSDSFGSYSVRSRLQQLRTTILKRQAGFLLSTTRWETIEALKDFEIYQISYDKKTW